jgi:hypothetical protein
MPIARKARSLESAQLINERILQRYVFEMLSKSSESRRKLLPEHLKPKATKFRVLIPEYIVADPPHRTDFRIIFNDNTNANVEVEWTTSKFRHGPNVALTHYTKDNGFLLVLQDDRNRAESYTKDVNVVQIDPEEFFWWFAKNAPRLLGATMALHTDGYQVRETKYWVIYVGKLGGAEDDYLNKGFPKGVWAFRYVQGSNFTNVTSINSGDIVVFTTGWKTPGGRQIYPEKGWSTSRVDVLKVTRGYWCDYMDRTFERADWDGKPETKQYMHYFAYDRLADSEKLFLKGKLSGTQFKQGDDLDKEICDALRMSNTQRGAPFELSQEAFARLLQHLHAMTPLIRAN